MYMQIKVVLLKGRFSCSVKEFVDEYDSVFNGKKF